MKFTYYGHACFMVEINGKKILFDPFIKPNELAKDIDIQTIQPDYILISHGHFDHMSDALDIALQSNATIVSNFEIVSWYQSKGVKNTHPMNHGGKWAFDFGTVRFTNAVHSSVLPDGTYGGNPGGFVIESSEGNFYYAGDTALTMDMKLIPLVAAKLNFAVFPIGDNFTMGLTDSIIAAEFCEVQKIIGVHYDTFGYIKIDHQKAQEAFQLKGKELLLLSNGEELNIN
ncbi:MAG: metal-dependent hydrolase [Bacteroidota bacterium]